MVVHFRLGDYLQEKKFGIVKEDYFINAINLLSKKYDYEKIVLFTNDKNEALERFAKIKDKNLVVISEDYGLTPSENLELMRLGSGYVLSNSTFGWWGAFLSHNSNPPVVCPRPWFKGYDEPKHLIPSNWIRIDTD
jgi:predicted HAD superfamily hydrolase